ncbi:uncharacterized protein LOC130813405 [Amaranthus tricolor]|uniref:uncharacterized protein LOC130813405 n=1 Tax=Amaranthus tricolor TaxID=29722 RepID=UPI00258A11B5|nr:uncharacterized protein LOC130813405 [Amaranthus tricolor]
MERNEKDMNGNKMQQQKQASISCVQNETHEQQQNPEGRKRNDIPTTNNNRSYKFVRVELGDNVNHFVIERDLGLHKQINEYHPNDREKASVNAVRWLACQNCTFRGDDESISSRNRGNFLELIKYAALYNDEVKKVVWENAPRNASYTPSTIQKEIFHIFASKVKEEVRKKFGEAKFCMILDESQDRAEREQMAILFRFVDKFGILKEQFFDLVHVKNTASLTLKEELYQLLSYHNLNITNVRGQGYEGASNMRGEFNGLKALILKDSPYAYYVHYFAHRLQLALIGATKEVIPIQ